MSSLPPHLHHHQLTFQRCWERWDNNNIHHKSLHPLRGILGIPGFKGTGIKASGALLLCEYIVHTCLNDYWHFLIDCEAMELMFSGGKKEKKRHTWCTVHANKVTSITLKAKKADSCMPTLPSTSSPPRSVMRLHLSCCFSFHIVLYQDVQKVDIWLPQRSAETSEGSTSPSCFFCVHLHYRPLSNQNSYNAGRSLC